MCRVNRFMVGLHSPHFLSALTLILPPCLNHRVRALLNLNNFLTVQPKQCQATMPKLIPLQTRYKHDYKMYLDFHGLVIINKAPPAVGVCWLPLWNVYLNVFVSGPLICWISSGLMRRDGTDQSERWKVNGRGKWCSLVRTVYCRLRDRLTAYTRRE